VNFLVRIIENLSQSLDDIRQEAGDLLWSTVSHVTDRFDCCILSSPVVSLKAFKEHWHYLLDSVITEVPDNLLVGSIRTSSHWLSGVCNAAHNIWKNFFDIRLKSLAL